MAAVSSLSCSAAAAVTTETAAHPGPAAPAGAATTPMGSLDALFSPSEAVAFYNECCKVTGMGPNRFFIKQLLLGGQEYNFDDGYLGVHGIVPVLKTLSRVAIVSLGLRNCGLDTEDIRVLCETFDYHPHLCRIDLRGNTLSDAAAKLLLQLVLHNRRIHEIQADKTMPRYLRVQQQCVANGCGGAVGQVDGNAHKSAGTCLVCGTPLIQENGAKATVANVNLLLSTLLDQFARTGDSASAAGVEILFRLLLAGCDLGDGVLFLCSDRCAEALGLDLLQCTRYVVTTCHLQMPGTAPKTPFLKDAAQQLIRELKVRQLPAGCYIEHAARENAGKDFSIARYLDEEAPGYREPKCRCAVCGSRTDGLPSVPAQLVFQLRRDFMKRALTIADGVGDNATPSIFTIVTRLAQVLARYAYEPVCSWACARDLVRFGIHGYCGVIRAYPRDVPLLSGAVKGGNTGVRASDVAMRLLPQAGFSIVDFVCATIDDIGEEDIICALTVASAMEDIDGVPMDPYFLHALARHSARQPSRSLGSELQSVCEVAMVTGCLAQSEAPLQRRNGDRPSLSAARAPSSSHSTSSARQPAAGSAPTSSGASSGGSAAAALSIADWQSWGTLFGQEAVEKMLHTAFARRRQGLYLIDGPHGNLFDNTRAALWNFRNQRRCALVAMEFFGDWLTSPDGIIADAGFLPTSEGEKSVGPHKATSTSFHTTVKVVGQSIIANSCYLILQGNFGPTAGNRGFFYMDKSTFVRHVSGNAYMFLDVAAIDHNRGGAASFCVSSSYAATVASPASLNLAMHSGHARVLFKEVSAKAGRMALPPRLREKMLCAIVAQRGKADYVMFSEDSKADSTPMLTRGKAKYFDYMCRLVDLEGVLPVSQLLFLLSEVCDADTASWASDVVSRFRQDVPSVGYALLRGADEARAIAHKAKKGADAAADAADTADEWLLVSPRAAMLESSRSFSPSSTLPSASLRSMADHHQQGITTYPNSTAAAATTSSSSGGNAKGTSSGSGARRRASSSSTSVPRRRSTSAGSSSSGGRDGGRLSTASSSPSSSRPASASASRQGSRGASRRVSRSSSVGSASAASVLGHRRGRKRGGSVKGPRSSTSKSKRKSTSADKKKQKKKPSGGRRRSSSASSASSRRSSSTGRRRRSSSSSSTRRSKSSSSATSRRGASARGKTPTRRSAATAETKGKRQKQRLSIGTPHGSPHAAGGTTRSPVAKTPPTKPPQPHLSQKTPKHWAAEAIPTHVVGKPWSLIHLSTDSGKPSRYVAAFIEDLVCVCKISSSGSTSKSGASPHMSSDVVLPLMPMKQNPLFADLAFCTGFDCVFNHPLRPREVYFLSGSFCVTWDAFTHECTAGPLLLSTSPMFANLPTEFHSDGSRKLDSIVPIPGTPYVVLFSQSLYAVYDVENGVPVSEPLQLRKSSSREERIKSEGLLAMAEEARAAAAAKVRASKESPSKEALLALEGHMWNAAMPLFDDELVEKMPRSPVTGFWSLADDRKHHKDRPASPDGASPHEFNLVTASGKVFTVALPADAAKWKHHRLSAVRQTRHGKLVLRGLPAALQQTCTASLPSVCDAALRALSPTVDTHALVPFDASQESAASLMMTGMPESMGMSVTSTLPCTENGRLQPLRLLSLREGSGGAFPRLSPSSTCSSSPTAAQTTLAATTAAATPGETLSSLVQYRGDGASCRTRLEKARRSSVTLGSGSPIMAHTITLDLGQGRVESFAAVALVLDTSRVHPSVFQHAPMTVAVEVSEDGVIFREHSRFQVGGGRGDGTVSAAAWREETHACRYWQLRFLSNMPADVGVVRTIWFASTNVLPAAFPHTKEVEQLEMLSTYLVPRDIQQSNVLIDAPTIFCQPINLLNHMPMKSVFTTAGPLGAAGWYAPHAFIPLLAKSEKAPFFRVKSTCLIVCGGDFLEFDLSAKEVVRHRNLTLAKHPAFRNLPHPFCIGLHGAFYIDPADHPDQVVLLSHGHVLHWDLSKGQMVPGACIKHFHQACIFSGIPISITDNHELIGIVNDFNCNSELLVLYRPRTNKVGAGRCIGAVEVLRWNFVMRDIAERPLLMTEHPLFQHQLKGIDVGAQLHCLFMAEPSEGYTLFVGDKVATAPYVNTRSTDALKSHSLLMASAASPSGGVAEECCLSKRFYHFPVYLPQFGTPQHSTSVVLDLRAAPVLAMGLELSSTHSSVEGVGETWQLAYSDDNKNWFPIGYHTHRGTTSRATWRPSQVGKVSHRFWRITSTSNSSNEKQPVGLLYTQLRLLTFAQRHNQQAPSRVALSTGATLEGTTDAKDLFRSAVTTSLQPNPAVGVNFAPGRATLTVDYGRLPLELTGFACVRSRPTHHQQQQQQHQEHEKGMEVVDDEVELLQGVMDKETWTVECSDDGETWTGCGSWRNRRSREDIQLHWAPLHPSRFWRVTVHPLEIDRSRMTLSRFIFYAYDGVTVYARNGRHQMQLQQQQQQQQLLPSSAFASEDDTTYVTASVVFQSTVTTGGTCSSACGNVDSSAGTTAAMPIAVGSTLTLDTKATTPAALTGASIRCSSTPTLVSATARIEFVVEFSANGKHWYAATSVLFFTGQIVPIEARWSMLGCFRFWRLRVVDTDGSDDGELHIDAIKLIRAQPQLYRSFLSHNSTREPLLRAAAALMPSADSGSNHNNNTRSTLSGDLYSGTEDCYASMSGATVSGPQEVETVYLRLPLQQPVVRVCACLPPSSMYAVERLGLDGISWETVATLRNVDRCAHKEVSGAWPRGSPSSTWRLRSLASSSSTTTTAAAAPSGRLRLPVNWYAFAKEQALSVDLNNIPNVNFAHEGFTELMASELLFRGKSSLEASNVVLRAEAVTPAICPTSGEDAEAPEVAQQSSATLLDMIMSRTTKSSSIPSSSASGDALAPALRVTEPRMMWKMPLAVAFHSFYIKGRMTKVFRTVSSNDQPLQDNGETHMTDTENSARSDKERKNRRRRTGSAGSRSSKQQSKQRSRSTGARMSGKEKSSVAAKDGASAKGEQREQQQQQQHIDQPADAAMVVETSVNGTDFVAVAVCSLLGIDKGKTVSWDKRDGLAAPYWRVRLTHVPVDHEVSLITAFWNVLWGVPGVVSPSSTLVTSNTAYTTWHRDLFSNETVFCDSCQRGFEQAKSQASKLRAEGDMDRIGFVADGVWRLKKRFAAFVAKLSKDVSHKASSNEGALLMRVPPHVLPLLSSGKELATDLIYFMQRIADKYPESNVDCLIELAGAPINLGKGMNFARRESPAWFYPQYALYGGVKENFHGIDSALVMIAFNVHWSLSHALQCDSDLLAGASGKSLDTIGAAASASATSTSGVLSELNPHVASPLLSVFWEHKKGALWSPTECFPELPSLQYAGFGFSGTTSSASPSASPLSAAAPRSKSPATVFVCAVNEVPFSSRYPLVVGEGGSAKTLPSPVFPFRVYPGVNFVQFSTVPPFLHDTLKILYRANFLEAYRTTLVLTAPSLASHTCQLRFTLPATEGGACPGGCVNFGIDNVSLQSLEFEVSLKSTPVSLMSLGDEAEHHTNSNSAATRALLRKRQYAFDFHVNVISHGAVYTVPTDGTTITPTTSNGGSPLGPVSSPMIMMTTVAAADGEPATEMYPLSILGNLDACSVSVPLRCYCANANMPHASSPHIVITEFVIDAVVERVPGGLSCPPLTLTGRLTVSGAGRSVPFSYTVPRGVLWNAPTEVHIDLLDLSLRDFVLCSRVLLRTEAGNSTAFQKKQNVIQQEWLTSLPVNFVSGVVTLDVLRHRISGTGVQLRFYNAVARNTSVNVSADGFLLAASFASVHVGTIVLESAVAADGSLEPVALAIGDVNRCWEDRTCDGKAAVAAQSACSASTTDVAATILLQVRGCSCLTSARHPTPMTLELSKDSMLCIGSSSSADVSLAVNNGVMLNKQRTVTYDAIHPACETAQVSLNSDALYPRIAAAIGQAPIVMALRAKGLPFTFTPQELSVVEPMRMGQHRLTVVLRGVFFGNWFEVFASVAGLGGSQTECTDLLCASLALKVLEQSSEALWKSYANVIGVYSKQAGKEGDTFLSSWADRERGGRANAYW